MEASTTQLIDQGFGVINIFVLIFAIAYFRKINFSTMGFKGYELPLTLLAASLALFAFAEFLSFVNYIAFDDSYLESTSGFFEVLFAIGFLSSVFLAKTSEDREFDNTKRASVRDGLTGLYNPAYFDVQGSNMFHQARFEKMPLSAIFLDVDQLKSYSDKFGDEQGHAVLKLLAASLKKLTRSEDAIVRQAGDKFVILSPSDAAIANRIAHRVCRFVEQNFTPENQPQLKRAITVSLGVATVNNETSDLQALVHKACQASLTAKSSGRNRVIALV